MIQNLVKITEKLISKSFSNLSKPHIKNMSELIVAFFFNKSFSLRDIASNLPGESNVKHKLKRLIYFLDTLKIDKNFWQNYVKTIFSLPYFKLGKRKYITLLIDATTLKDDFWILTATISYKGRSIPIYLKLWKGVNESYDYWERVRGFLKSLKGILPEKFTYEIIADMGFQGHKMFDLCEEIGWDYVVRINGSYKVKTKTGEEFVQLSLFDDGMYKDIILGIKNKVEGTNVVINSIQTEAGDFAKWYLATNLEEKEPTVNDYTRRMWIEETFKDLKGELKWETYTKKLPDKSRIEKTIIISCLSYAIRLCLAEKIELPPSEEKKTSIFKRVQHLLVSAQSKIEGIYCKILSLFSLRLWRLSHIF
jgi:hypothetical protein